MCLDLGTNSRELLSQTYCKHLFITKINTDHDHGSRSVIQYIQEVKSISDALGAIGKLVSKNY